MKRTSTLLGQCLIIVALLLTLPGLGFQPAAAQGTIADVEIVTDYLNMRAAPNDSAAVVQQLPNGTLLAARGRNTDTSWLFVATEAGVTGWVKTSWVAVRLDLDLNSLPYTEANGAGGAPPAAEAPAEEPPAAPVAAAPAASTANSRGFALGGQIQGYGQANWMHAAGMTWVKRQVVYGLGANPNDIAGMINEAHANGFQILLSVKGHADELANDPNYLQSYAGYLGGLAALGADGIEVRNEMNIDREWPAGRIDPGWYTQMLAAAYNAIKSNNSATLVVSGAPAPTGAEGAFGLDRVWNDDRYIRGMAAAGAANYMDCIGIHYNEGIVPPDWNSGDPRGNYYTRYYAGMVNTYSSAFGGRRPLCFTEIGYLTPEGYGALPGGFAWAGDVTVANQAAWLTRAAQIARSSGRVRLFIVWNVDFLGTWGEDPMAGYAIVRPGGDCPACNALAGLW